MFPRGCPTNGAETPLRGREEEEGTRLQRKGRGGAGRENPDLRQDPERCRCGQGHRALLATGHPPTVSSPSHAGLGTGLSSLLELAGCLSAAQRARRGVTRGHRRWGGSRRDPTAPRWGGRGDPRSPGHLGILAVMLITGEIVLQPRAQPLGSPSGCFLLEKGVLGRVAAPRGTGPEGDPPQGVAAGALRAFLRQIGLSPSSRALAPGEPAPPSLGSAGSRSPRARGLRKLPRCAGTGSWG